MNIKNTIPLLTMCGLLAVSVGCSQKETPPPPSSPDTSTPPAAATAPPQPAASPTQAAAGIQDRINAAKALADQGKYTEALQSIGELAGLTLSAEQKALVDDLKKSVEEAAAKAAAEKAANGAAKAIGDALGGNK